MYTVCMYVNWDASGGQLARTGRVSFCYLCSLMRRALSVIVPFCSLSGSGKGVAGLSFGFLKGQFGAISGDAALLARLTRCLPVWLAQSAP